MSQMSEKNNNDYDEILDWETRNESFGFLKHCVGKFYKTCF